jgi:hypothetical protein
MNRASPQGEGQGADPPPLAAYFGTQKWRLPSKPI